MMKLTAKGNNTLNLIYKVIVDYTMENLYPPTIPEIKELSGIKSTSSIQTSLMRLESEGKIELGDGNRCIKLSGYKLVLDDMSKEKAVTRIKHRIERCSKRIEEYAKQKENLSIHGYWSLGYFEGRKSVLEEILDELNELEE